MTENVRGMKVEIACDYSQNWYSDKIGQIFIAHSMCSKNRNRVIVKTTNEQAGWPYGWVKEGHYKFLREEEHGQPKG